MISVINAPVLSEIDHSKIDLLILDNWFEGPYKKVFLAEKEKFDCDDESVMIYSVDSLNHPIACILLSTNYKGGIIRFMAVSPEWRGSGILQKLLASYEPPLIADPVDLRAAKALKKAGFKCVGSLWRREEIFE